MLGTETMTSKKGFRKAEGDFLRAAAGAAVLIVTATCATLWAGSAMAASDSGARQLAAPMAQPSDSLGGMVLAVGGVLVALVGVVVASDYGRRRIARRRAGGRRGGIHARAHSGLQQDQGPG
jgi:hypothetical protein